MVVLINNNKDLDQQDQYSRAWFLVAMVAFKGLMEATISNFTLSIVQLELTYESLLPKKLMSQSLSLSEKSCQPWSKRPLLRTKDFFALEVDLRLWRNVLISLFLYIIMKNWIFQLFLLSCWKPRIPDGFWFLCYLLQVHVLRKTKSRFYYQIEINMWHYKEYSPSSYMWKKKLWRIKKHWKIRQIASFRS